MDTKLLVKLIKLANNNPNDHEANSAARRVCKMLDDYKFPALAPPSSIDETVINEFHRAARSQAEYYRRTEPRPGVDYNDYFRSKEPGKSPPGSDREAKKAKTETQSSPHQGTNRDPYADFKVAYEDIYGMGNDWPGENVKKNLKCTKCGHTKSTRYRGLPENWVCMECRGKEYMKSKL